MQSHALAYIVITIILWGFWGYFGKMALTRGMKPISVFIAEACFGFLLGLVLFLFLFSYSNTSFSFNDWNWFGIFSGFAMSMGLLTYYLALQHEDIHVVVPLTAVYPIIAVALGVIFIGESLEIHQIFGVILLSVGTVLLLA